MDSVSERGGLLNLPRDATSSLEWPLSLSLPSLIDRSMSYATMGRARECTGEASGCDDVTLEVGGEGIEGLMRLL